MTSYRNWGLATLALTCLSMATVVGFNYAIDPLQFYRKAWYLPHFSDQQRYQTPGLAKNYPYDTIILGTSMTDNFRPSYMDQKLGTRTLKLSIDGSTSREQRMIGELAINTGKVKRVIWGIDYFSLRGGADRVRDDYGPFPYYLFDQNPWNDVSYLFSYSTTRDSLKMLALTALKRKNNSDLDVLNNYSAESTFSKDKVWADWDKRTKDPASFKPEEYALSNLLANIDSNIVALVKANPTLQFDILYPPPSVLLHRFFYERSKEGFLNEAAAKKHLFEQLGSLPNVKIYDFQADESITHRLENFKDMTHYSQSISDYLIDSMGSDRYRVTNANVDTLNHQLEQQVLSLDMSLLK